MRMVTVSERRARLARRHHLAAEAPAADVFVFPTDLVPVVQAACTDAIVARERKRLVSAVEQSGIAADGTRWLAQAERATLEALTAGGPSTGAQLSKAVPELQVKVSYESGRLQDWVGETVVNARFPSPLHRELR